MYQDKEWVVMEGLRNSGKGVLLDLVRHAFGKYVGATNAENFYAPKGGGDEAKKRSWMIDFEFKRICAMNECAIEPDGSTTLCGNAIKKFTSGGDELSTRKNYQDETTFMLQATPFLCVNDMPSVKPTDALSRCVQFNFLSKFCKGSEKAKWESRQLRGVEVYAADDSVKEIFIRSAAVRNEFVLMLLEAYHGDASYPASIKVSAEEDMDDDVGDLLDLITMTGKDKDYIAHSELKAKLSEMENGLTIRKAGKILRAKGATSDKISGGHRILRGVKWKEDEPEIEEEDEPEPMYD
jgi:hypothetical protein